MARFRPLSLAIAVLALALSAAADVAGQRGQEPPTAAGKAGAGEGPYRRLIIRGATVIDGTGAPPQGPMDIVIEGNRIVEVRSVGYPHLPINESRRPQGADREIDATGMYVMPGFVDLHVHAGGGSKNPAEYAYERSEEHTSELQSREKLVCRLLLEKK